MYLFFHMILTILTTILTYFFFEIFITFFIHIVLNTFVSILIHNGCMYNMYRYALWILIQVSFQLQQFFSFVWLNIPTIYYMCPVEARKCQATFATRKNLFSTLIGYEKLVYVIFFYPLFYNFPIFTTFSMKFNFTLMICNENIADITFVLFICIACSTFNNMWFLNVLIQAQSCFKILMAKFTFPLVCWIFLFCFQKGFTGQ